MRPPPGGTFAQSACFSAPQNERIASASRGRVCGIGPNGATTGAAGAAAAGATGAAAGAAGVPPLPMAATALPHAGESCAELICRHSSAAALPGFTPGQCATKSERHAARAAPICFWVGFLCTDAGGAGSAGGGGALTRAGSGFVAAGGGTAPSVAGFAPTTSSPHRHAADTLPAFRCMSHGNA
jgi:hypothetical protein